MNKNPIDYLEGHDYINLKTRKKSGETVPTPVWFVKTDHAVYVTTRAKAGKLKRIRNFSDVEIAPCDVRGGLLGDWLSAKAHEVTDQALRRDIHTLFGQKYGDTDMWARIEPPDSPNRAFIAVSFNQD